MKNKKPKPFTWLPERKKQLKSVVHHIDPVDGTITRRTKRKIDVFNILKS